MTVACAALNGGWSSARSAPSRSTSGTKRYNAPGLVNPYHPRGI